MTDEQIIDLFFARSEKALLALQAQYGAYCASIARRMLSDPRDEEECLNDCYLAVWNAIPPHTPQHFKGWLGAIVRHRALSIGQKNARLEGQVDDTALELASCLPAPTDAHTEAEANELAKAISDFLWTQKEAVRMAFVRRYWYTDSVQQIAERMGWSVSKTKSVLFRARNHLKQYLNQEGFL